jgi:ABC-type nitrate/sulfonate/bicarbonate transport system ATPase subunit
MAVKLAVNGIGKDYLIPVIGSVDFTVDAGEFVCLLGPNGCGKTTLLRIVGGIEPATRGVVLLDGRPVVADERHERHVGIVFQEDRLLPWMSLRDNVALVLKPLGLDREAREARAMTYLRLAGLQGFEGYYPGRVSGGMRQRVAIARALAIEPDVLLMDEPFGALDAQNRDFLQAQLDIIQRSEQKTIIFVTHDVEEAIFLADRIVIFSARPARILEEVRVCDVLPSERTLEHKDSEVFFRLRNRILGITRAQALRTEQLMMGANTNP